MERSDYDLLPIDDVARTIGYTVRHVRRMVVAGEFPDGFPAPKQLRWRWATVRDWVLRHEAIARAAAEQVTKKDNRGHSGTSGKAT